MSHTVTINIEVRDRAALLAACQRLGLRTEEGTFKMYSSTETGLAVWLPGWKYPTVITQDGSVRCDNYSGRWGDEAELDRLRQYYGIEKAKAEARKRGYSVYERTEEDGSVLLTIQEV